MNFLLFDLDPAASDFSDELETELLNDLVSSENIRCSKFWLRLEILLEYLWLSLIIRHNPKYCSRGQQWFLAHN